MQLMSNKEKKKKEKISALKRVTVWFFFPFPSISSQTRTILSVCSCHKQTLACTLATVYTALNCFFVAGADTVISPCITTGTAPAIQRPKPERAALKWGLFEKQHYSSIFSSPDFAFLLHPPILLPFIISFTCVSVSHPPIFSLIILLSFPLISSWGLGAPKVAVVN